MDTGLDGFKQLLKEFRELALWGAGGAAVPFAAQLAALSPPWPDGIVIITSIVELVTLVFVYQFAKSARRHMVNRILTIAALLMVLSGVSYLVANSIYTFKVPTTKERFVKGYRCTPNAQAVFKDKCPALDTDDLATANYEAERLWTAQSIATVRVILVALWLASFITLAVVLGSFVVYQAQVPSRKSQRVVSNEG
jgi:hypothetical protein